MLSWQNLSVYAMDRHTVSKQIINSGTLCDIITKKIADKQCDICVCNSIVNFFCLFQSEVWYDPASSPQFWEAGKLLQIIHACHICINWRITVCITSNGN